jgi:hypothetical protein
MRIFVRPPRKDGSVVELRFCERGQGIKGFIDDAEFGRLRILLQRAQRNAIRYRRGRGQLPGQRSAPAVGS